MNREKREKPEYISMFFSHPSFERLAFVLHRAMYSDLHMPNSDKRQFAANIVRQWGRYLSSRGIHTVNSVTLTKHLWQMFGELTSMDSTFFYYPQDLEWLTDFIVKYDKAEVVSSLFAYASCSREILTIAEVAELTGESEDVWERRAVNREVLAAQDADYCWLFSKLILQMDGYLNPSPPSHEGDETHENV